jgi:DNA-3-methyladenine glycosylase II
LSTTIEKAKVHLAQDPKLKTLIDTISMEISEGVRPDIYLILLDSIVSQQLSVKAATTIFNRFCDLFPDRYPQPQLILDMDAEAMRAVGLSYQKAGYIKNVATFAIEKDFLTKDWDNMTDDEIVNYLIEIKGVGKWTVQMLMMFSLHRPDVFPIDDLGVQNGMIQLYGITETGKALKQKMIEIATPWAPYRSIASRYIWRYKDGGGIVI